MLHNKIGFRQISWSFWVVIMLCWTTFTNAQEAPFGALGSKANPPQSIEQAMNFAIQDEYLARAEYQEIIAHYGSVKPFTNILQAEEQHISRLVTLYQQLKLPLPVDNAKDHVMLPSSIREAMSTGVTAEIDNIAMYDRFLTMPQINDAAYTEVKQLFIALRDASKKHLRAFEKGVAQYD